CKDEAATIPAVPLQITRTFSTIARRFTLRSHQRRAGGGRLLRCARARAAAGAARGAGAAHRGALTPTGPRYDSLSVSLPWRETSLPASGPPSPAPAGVSTACP